MARSGIYKSEVVRARNNLIAQGRHPSIDAVRVELGNTGSKVTIHRYLKEIEEDEGAKAKGRGVALSEALQSLTQKLAEQLQDEADQQVLLLKSSHAKELQASREQREQEARQHDNQVQFLQHEIHGLKDSLTQAQLKSAEAFQELARLTTELGGARRELAQQEKLKEQVKSLNERLATTQSQRDIAGSQLEHERQQTNSLRLELEKETGLRLAAAGRVQELGGEVLAMKVQLETSERVTEQIRFQVSKIIEDAAGKAATN